MANDAEDTREQGIEFGTLIDDLEDESFPLSHETLLDEYGDRELHLMDEEQVKLREVLSPEDGQEQEQGQTHEEEYEDVDSVQQAVFNMVGNDAIGLEGYTDRGGNPKEADSSAETESS